MDTKSLSSAELADRIGVQRSNVSHIINGRNNPSSVFIEKLLLTYPDLNARWLLVGEGEMLNSVSRAGGSDMKTLFDVINHESETLISNNIKEKPISTEKLLPNVKSKQIERIIMLFTDKTFSDYFPF